MGLNEAKHCGLGSDNWPDGKYRNIRFSPLLKPTDTEGDLIDESANGNEDLRRLFVNGTDYPRFVWQERLLGDFLCPDGSDFKDYEVLAGQW